MNEKDLLIDCLQRLNRTCIGYMIVGSMASNYWGIPRSTHDIDFVVDYTEVDVESIVSAFEGDFFIQESSVRSALQPPHQFNALDNRTALKVDFFRLAGDEYESQRFERRRGLTLFDQQTWMAAPEDVVLHKLRWNLISPSDKQLSDAAGIVAVSEELIDFDYLKTWANKIGVRLYLDRILDQSSS